MKRCPFCAEEIQDAATKCKHCGSMLVQPPPAAQQPQAVMRKRLGVTGWILLILGCAMAVGALLGMTIFNLGESVFGFAVGAGLVWWAWNTGAITISCPACRADLPTKMKATVATCAKCGHRVEMRPVS